jgi:hypothetical protein
MLELDNIEFQVVEVLEAVESRTWNRSLVHYKSLSRGDRAYMVGGPGLKA